MNYKAAFELVRREFLGARISTQGYETDEFFLLPPDDPEYEGLTSYVVWKETRHVEKLSATDPRIYDWEPVFLQNPVSVSRTAMQ
ncbi:hypothetical protein [Corynebacterium pseudopelargi]|uniref:Uncharacterized protein n=1 Tax=Corynebacterium pseudopelargi TaxID=2080757 RepID=A0A3G6J0U8_9CORY|nr:hypothetical protein [Corynebacterium pseudopelargi]AZA09764.1 hypothetical protein CPPEL_08300 [Corynebacterium pseudopelargi]